MNRNRQLGVGRRRSSGSPLPTTRFYASQESHSDNRILLDPIGSVLDSNRNPIRLGENDEILSDSGLRSDIRILSVGFDRILLSESD